MRRFDARAVVTQPTQATTLLRGLNDAAWGREASDMATAARLGVLILRSAS